MALPKAVWSTHGPVPVITITAPDGEYFGEFLAMPREIHVNSFANPDALAHVLFHEMVHIALSDVGAHNVLSKKKIELVCDAVGLYLAGAYKDGCVVLREPK